MKTSIKKLDNLLNSEEYQIYESETLLNIQYHIINTDKDIDEMQEYNENGDFGCSHSEFIDCWKEYLNTLTVFDPEYDEVEDMDRYHITIETYNNIMTEIDSCEEYHISHNTIDQVI